MGTKVSVEVQDDLGVLALAALRHAANRENTETTTTVCGAVAHIVPMLSESAIRQLMWETDRAITSTRDEAHDWVELMTVLRRVDRP